VSRKITYNHDEKFDIQFSEAVIAERRLGEIFTAKTIGSVELKTETWLWEQTGNLCIEYRCDGKPSGISVTKADYWVHELRRDGRTLVYLMFPMERLKELARAHHAAGNVRKNGGDNGRFDNIVIPLSEILK
jgi:hypothetical protein